METTNILHSLLNAYWLRPESAYLSTLDALSMKSFNMKKSSLDLGCGDGTFSFLLAGGMFEDDFDVFYDVSNLDKFFDGVDIFDSKNNQDISIKVSKPPKYKINVGLDLKESLLKKAERLGLYEELVQADANQKLPFENNVFQSIFCNILYWLDNPADVLKEIYRILNVGGVCCLNLPNRKHLEASPYYSLCIQNNMTELEPLLKKLDRGRTTDNLKTVKTNEQWEMLFREANLKVIDKIPHFSKTAVQIFEIGLRPIFPLLKEMCNEISPNKLLDIKAKWVNLFEDFCTVLIENDSMFANGEYTFTCYILQK